MKKMLLILLISITSNAFAYYKYDAQTGNSYNVQQYGDQTQVYGFNNNTGSNWQETYESNGNAHGTDSNGNYWTYDSSSGYYSNTDGTTCIGHGYARTCS